LHEDADARRVTVISDDERPLVLYGERDHEKLAEGGKANGERATGREGRSS
jgi:manganese/iron transport system ATP-binding protein